MHGVRKEKLPEEEEELKRKEKEKKVALFTRGRDVVIRKLQKARFDLEGLEVSGKLLGGNPDVTTFWNYRRRTLLHFAQLATNTKSKDQSEEEKPDDKQVPNERGGDADQDMKSPSSPVIDIEMLYRAELDLTFTCILKNPKSYGSWHQRGWVLCHMAQPDFNSEIKICNKALEMDERNFHCWDHRRLVCNLSKVSKEDELKFSDQKVETNFSNYSAWHYRSSLLSQLHPDPQGILPLDGSVLNKELELAANAFYTDPEDQSAWLYTTWLFQQKTDLPKPIILNSDFRIVGVDFNSENDQTTILLNFPIGSEKLKSILRFSDVAESDSEKSFPYGIVNYWSPTVLSNRGSSRIWTVECTGTGEMKKIPSPVFLSLRTADESSEPPKPVMVEVGQNWMDKSFLLNEIRPPPPPDTVQKALDTQMGHCKELIKMEPDNKWPLFTATQCMRRLNTTSKTLNKVDETEKSEMENNLCKLHELDGRRRQYYQDQRSRHVIETVLSDWLFASDKSRLSLRNQSLSALYFTSIMAIGLRELDISNNFLHSLTPLSSCVNLEWITASGNKLKSLRGLEKLSSTLVRVIVAENAIEKAEDVITFLNSAHKLTGIMIAENPLCKSDNEKRNLVTHFGEANVRVIFDFL